VPRWSCANEECGVCINDKQYQCAGCGGWFCPGCSGSFRGPEFRVCTAGLLVWGNLCHVQETACVVLSVGMCGKTETRFCVLLVKLSLDEDAGVPGRSREVAR